MPTYDYKCEKCGHEFEDMLPISRRNEPTKVPCTMRILDANQDPQCFDCDGEVKMMFAKPYVGDPWHFAGKKVDDGFKDRLKEIKSKHLHSTIDVH